MICPKCGNVMDDNETSCKNCGTKIKEASVVEDNSVSRGGGVTKTPTLEEQRAVQEQMARQAAEIVPQQPVYNQAPLQKQVKNLMNNNNNYLLALVIGLIAVIAIFGGIVICKKLNNSETVAVEEKSDKVGDTSKKVESESSTSKDDEGEAATPSETDDDETSTDVVLGTYTFSFPSTYESKLNSGMGISVDKTNKIQVVYTVINNVPYYNALAAKEDYKSYLSQNGFTVSAYNEYTYGNRKWLIYSGILSNMNSMYAITEFGDVATFQATIFNLGDKTNDVLFSELNGIIDNAKSSDTSNSNNANDASSVGASDNSLNNGSSNGSSSSNGNNSNSYNQSTSGGNSDGIAA